MFSDLGLEEEQSQRRGSTCQSTGLVLLSNRPCKRRIYTGADEMMLAQKWWERKFKLNICCPFCSAGTSEKVKAVPNVS